MQLQTGLRGNPYVISIVEEQPVYLDGELYELRPSRDEKEIDGVLKVYLMSGLDKNAHRSMVTYRLHGINPWK
jgi:hypothetical protein